MSPNQQLAEKETEQAGGKLPPLEEFAEKFSRRYTAEEPFRDLVHEYLSLTWLRKTKLAVGRKILPGWYRRTTAEMLQEYASKVRTDLQEVYTMRSELGRLGEAQKEMQQASRTVEETRKNQEELQRELREKEQLRGEAEARLQQELAEKQSEEELRLREERQRIIAGTDPRKHASAVLEQVLGNLPGVVHDEHGNFTYDEKKMVERLEDLFLKEIVSGIEQEEGTGFLARVQDSYEGLVTHWEQIDSLSQLGQVDWTKSIIRSRIHGYRLPTFPYLEVGVGESQGRASVNAAIAVDCSGSMTDNRRIEVARKTTLATHALLRKLNPRNCTYLAYYNAEVQQVTTAEFLKVEPWNGTNTHLALKWLLETLEGHGPGMAYLITDGLPNEQQSCIDAAQQFRNYPYLLLRIFLIDGNEKAEGYIREIGKAAGTGTKVLPIANYQLEGGMIKDVHQAIGEMYNVGEF